MRCFVQRTLAVNGIHLGQRPVGENRVGSHSPLGCATIVHYAQHLAGGAAEGDRVACGAAEDVPSGCGHSSSARSTFYEPGADWLHNAEGSQHTM